MHITLTGNLGSGKSTISKIFAKDYGYEVYSTGRVIREFAEERGISVLEMNKLMSEDPKYDHMIDQRSAEISRTRKDDNIFYDSRLAWHFVDRAFRVFLTVSLDVSVDRIMGDSRGNVEKYDCFEDCKEKLKARVAEEDKRYKELYHINYFDFSNYNLILDSTACPADILAAVMHDEEREYDEVSKNGKDYTRFIICKERGLTDFKDVADKCDVTVKTLHGHEFYYFTLDRN